MKKHYCSNIEVALPEKTSIPSGKSPQGYLRSLWLSLLFLCSVAVYGQSGGWNGSSSTGNSGYIDHGNGVIQLLNTNSDGCAGAAVYVTSDKYFPCNGVSFNKCYKVFFGCPGNDDFGSDSKGDGMAFSFYNCGSYNINNGACGGGLGYHGACNKMITVEFDTYNSGDVGGFEGVYEGTGNEDQVAIHFDGIAEKGGKLVGRNPGNLEDGLEHDVCFNYNPATNTLTTTIDGVVVLAYDLGPTYNLQTYFGCGAGLNQAWSSGKHGATNPTTVSLGTDISDQLGGAPLCPAGVQITSPYNGASFGGGCAMVPLTITASAVPPAGHTVQKVEFFVDGIKIGEDFTEPYSYVWATPTEGSHNLTAVAHYTSGGGPSTQTSAAVNVNVGGGVGVQLMSPAPSVSNGIVDPVWSNFAPVPLTKGYTNGNNLNANYKMTYDNTNLYLLVEVTDSDLSTGHTNFWENDGIEIFFDIGNHKATNYNGIDDFQYAIVWNSGTIRDEKHGGAATAGVQFEQIPKAGPLGYYMEIIFPWSTLKMTAPNPGTKFGFDVKVNDADGGPGRNHELAWHHTPSAPVHDNPSLMGTQELLSCGFLPVELLAFNATKEQGKILLDWLTLTETDNLKFVVERSYDAQTWERIGEVAGAGDSKTMQYYQYTDATYTSDQVYYRLVQLDTDGTFSYSKTIVVNGSAYDISVMPNPFEDILTIRTNGKGILEIILQDVLGKEVYREKTTAEKQQIEIQPDLPSGAYVLVVKTQDRTEQYKIIKR
jgi:hypothetical protein